ncbi:hypothetical protein [Shimia sp.]|uniref:hypothetical protein n=1 Tax=Shimia sp. TaxID=1954381 RepID=UPI0032989104
MRGVVVPYYYGDIQKGGVGMPISAYSIRFPMAWVLKPMHPFGSRHLVIRTP